MGHFFKAIKLNRLTQLAQNTATQQQLNNTVKVTIVNDRKIFLTEKKTCCKMQCCHTTQFLRKFIPK